MGLPEGRSSRLVKLQKQTTNVDQECITRVVDVDVRGLPVDGTLNVIGTVLDT